MNMWVQCRRTIVAALLLMASSTAAFAVKGDVCKYGNSKGELSESEARVFTMHQKSEIYRIYDKNCDGRLSAAELANYEAAMERDVERVRHSIARAKRQGFQVKVDADGDTSSPIIGPGVSPPPEPASNFLLYLRDSPEDVGVYDEPTPFKEAIGASFSYSRDGVINNNSFAAKGVAGYAYNWYKLDPDGGNAPDGAYLAALSSSGWTSFNWLSNSAEALKSKQTDVLSFGGTGEVAFAKVFNATQYFRVKGAYNTDFEGAPHSWSTTLEWQPVSSKGIKLSSPFEIGPYLTGRIDPILRFQYTAREGKSLDPIFALHNDVSRIGPVLSLNIMPKNNLDVVPPWLRGAVFNATYEWLQDIDTRQTYQWVSTAMTLPIDASGHLGLKVNYQRGRIEETGAKIDQLMAGLSARW